MNRVVLVGRLVRDNELKYSTGEKATAVLRNSIAVNRRFKNASGGYDADFPNIVAFGSQAEFINKYFHKGDVIGVEGRIATGSYTNKDGVKVYTTEVAVDSVEFVGSKGSNDGAGSAPAARQSSSQGSSRNTTASNDAPWMNVPEGGDGELPF